MHFYIKLSPLTASLLEVKWFIDFTHGFICLKYLLFHNSKIKELNIGFLTIIGQIADGAADEPELARIFLPRYDAFGCVHCVQI